MALIISLGSNIGDRQQYIDKARSSLQLIFNLEAQSHIYQSKAVDYTDQPDFYNQLLQFSLPDVTPLQALDHILGIEKALGRERTVPKGPRNIDIDIIFWQLDDIDCTDLTIPHPRLFSRSFIVIPLRELPYYDILCKTFTFSDHFPVNATPID